MAGNDIATDALRMQLVLDIEGEAEALAKLQRINSVSDTLNAKARRAAEDLDMQRLAVEGKYNPDIQRELEYKRLIALQEQLNLSTETFVKIKEKIDSDWMAKSSTTTGFRVESTEADVRGYIHLQQVIKETADLEVQQANKAAVEKLQIERKLLEATLDAQRQVDAARDTLQEQFNNKQISKVDLQSGKKQIDTDYGIRVAEATKLAEAEERIVDARRAAEQLDSQKLLKSLPKGNLDVSAIREQQELEKKAADKLVQDRLDLNRQLEQIEFNSLSAREKAHRSYVERYNEIREKLRSGAATTDQFKIVQTDNTRRYAAELNAIQEQEAKAAEIRKRAADNRVAEVNAETQRLNREIRRRNDAAIEDNQRRARITIDAQLAEDATRNARTQRAQSIMRGFQTETQRAAEAIKFFDTELRDGIITAQQHALAIENVNTRMRSMQRGAGNTAYVIGNLATGVEDFVTVISMTGFGMDGFAAATRSASNNIGQAVRGIGTASAAIMAPMISIGAVLVGFAIPAVYRWVTGSEDAAKVTEKWRLELEKLVRIAKVASTIELRNLENSINARDISKMFDTSAIDSKMEDITDSIARKQIELQETIKVTAKKAQNLLNALNPVELEEQFNQVADAIGDLIGPNLEQKFRNTFKTIQDEFKSDAIVLGSAAAIDNYQKKVAKLVSDLGATRASMLPVDQVKFDYMIAGMDRLFGSNAFINPFFEFMNDTEVIDHIQAIRDQVDALSKEETLAAGKLKKELKDYALSLENLLKQREIAAEHEKIARQEEMDADKESLLQEHRAIMMKGEEFEAERRLLEIAKRRQEVMESGLAGAKELENMVNAELEAELKLLEKQLAESQHVDYKATTVGQAEAYTAVARISMEAATKDRSKEQEVIELIKGIKALLAGGPFMKVQIAQ